MFFIFFCFQRENREEYIQQTMRDNLQLLVNELWQVEKTFTLDFWTFSFSLSLLAVSLGANRTT